MLRASKWLAAALVGSKVGLLDYGKYHTQLHFDSWNRNASILLNIAVDTDSERLMETPCVFLHFKSVSVAFNEPAKWVEQ